MSDASLAERFRRDSCGKRHEEPLNFLFTLALAGFYGSQQVIGGGWLGFLRISSALCLGSSVLGSVSRRLDLPESNCTSRTPSRTLPSSAAAPSSRAEAAGVEWRSLAAERIHIPCHNQT
jgi:hypothetical protein